MQDPIAPPTACEASSGAGCSQFPFAALRQAKICMAEVADKCITDAVAAKDQYAKWSSQERAKTIRADIAEIEKLELDWCNGVITANPKAHVLRSNNVEPVVGGPNG